MPLPEVVVVVVVVVICFYLHPKKQLIIIEDKIEQRLQIGRRQLNDIRYNMHKKLSWSPHPCLNIENLKVHWQKKEIGKSYNTLLQVTSQECIA